VGELSEREVLNLVLGLVIVLVSTLKREVFRSLPGHRRLAWAGAWLVVAWTATVIEHLAFFVFFDVVEHLAYGAAAVALTSWVTTVPRSLVEPR
jgi:hypothetical protein